MYNKVGLPPVVKKCTNSFSGRVITAVSMRLLLRIPYNITGNVNRRKNEKIVIPLTSNASRAAAMSSFL